MSFTPALLPGEKGKKLGRLSALVSFMSLLAVYLAIRMSMARAI
ncbi:hypothetical protein [Thermococcus aggregans]|nr:hypothetical protein [Thermococcus aggregans]